MDAVKIIKKHGVPAGLPVITVYVDSDAPGESGKLFLHIVESATNSYVIITTDETPFTTATLAKFLYDCNLRSQNHFYPAYHTSFIQNAPNKVRATVTHGLYSTNGTTITRFSRQNDLSVDTNNLVCNTEIRTTSIDVVNDIVNEL